MGRTVRWLFAAAGIVAAPVSAQDAGVPTETSGEPVPEPPGAEASEPDARIRALEERMRILENQLALRVTPEPPAAPAQPASRHTPEPFAWGDFSWVPGNYGPAHSALQVRDGELRIDGEVRLDGVYHYSFAQPVDHTISGSSEVFRHGEWQLTQIGAGGNIAYGNVHARLMTQFGMYSQTTARNDSSPSRGQWNLADAYRYFSEAYAGIHIDELQGINIQAGIFMSYVGLWAYYNFDNWTYQPSYVSSNTPWFFNGIRVQIFVNENLKIEPWLVNGWQSYGTFNEAPGVGLQILWRPFEWFSILGNQYAGTDTLGNLNRGRIHTDDSVMMRYFNDPTSLLNRAAFSVTIDAGCEFGGGVDCSTQYFLGFMLYNRVWLDNNHFGLTIGGGAITNPGQYLVLLPPINGATAATGTPSAYYNWGGEFQAWDFQLTADYMPFDTVTFRLEFNHRASSVPYFSGHGGVTPPAGSTTGPDGMVTLAAGSPWSGPDLAYSEDRLSFAMMLRL